MIYHGINQPSETSLAVFVYLLCKNRLSAEMITARTYEEKSQIKAQGRAFEGSGGFSERLTARCVEARDKAAAASPECRSVANPCADATRLRVIFGGVRIIRIARELDRVDFIDRIDK